MNLIVGKRYQITYREPGFKVPLRVAAEYLGEHTAALPEPGMAFRRETDGPRGYLLLSPALLVNAVVQIHAKGEAPRSNEAPLQPAGTAG